MLRAEQAFHLGKESHPDAKDRCETQEEIDQLDIARLKQAYE